MIPKKIHYCWFGNNVKPPLVLHCLESWKKYCPEYEIIEWNETNWDYRKFRFSLDAYNAKKWAFVTDVARLDILINEGGIYFDTDVELKDNISDLLYNDAFFFWETEIYVASGLGFGCVKGNAYLKSILQLYQSNIEFDSSRCSRLASPKYVTKGIINIYRELRLNGKTQNLPNRTVIYSHQKYTKYANHLGMNSWTPSVSHETTYNISSLHNVYHETCIKRWLRSDKMINFMFSHSQTLRFFYIFVVYDVFEYGSGYYLRKLIKKILNK